MKKISCVLFCCIFLCGCVFPDKINKDTVLSETKFITESSLPMEQEGTWKEATEEVKTENNKDYSQSAESFTDDIKADLMREQQDLYYFSNLEITQQNLYVEILYGLENYIEDMKVSTIDTAQIDKVFQCVLMDHPEIFYTDGYSFVKYMLGDEVKKITFEGAYVYTKEEKEKREILLEDAVSELLGGISKDAGDYEKVKYIYETIIKNTEYDMEAIDNQNICSVFLNGASVCQGYAKAVQYLLMRLNIPATLVVGTVDNGEGHAWNLVKVNNQYYYLDATWGDASYLFHLQEGQGVQNIPAINYDYLCVTTEEILRTHALGTLVPLPNCNNLEANYYVQEGAYFTSLDYEQLEQLIKKYKEEGRETLTLRCSDDAVYQQMAEELLKQQKIFRYLDNGSNSILYTDASKQRCITFWL